MPYLSKDWRDGYNIFHEGVKSDKPRWEECLDYMMDQGMDVALSSLYVRNHCDPETKKMVSHLKVADLGKYCLTLSVLTFKMVLNYSKHFVNFPRITGQLRWLKIKLIERFFSFLFVK